MKAIKMVVAVVLIVVMAGAAQAAITTVALWRMGEDDAAPVDFGGVNNPTADAVGGFNWGNWWNTPHYRNSLAVQPSTWVLTADDYNPGTNAAVAGFPPISVPRPGAGNPLTFAGADVYARFDGAGRNEPNAHGTIFSFGENGGAEMLEIGVTHQIGGDPARHRFNLAVAGSGTTQVGWDLTLGQWYHLAAVSDATTSYLYIDKLDGNGAQLEVTIAGVGNDNAMLGNDKFMDWDASQMDWYGDNLRTFTFQGTFNPDDVFGGDGPPIPEPAGIGLIGVALLAVRRKRS